MRVAQMIDSLQIGGTQRMLTQLVELLCQRGVELAVISLQDDADSPFAAQIQAQGVRVINFPARKLLNPRRIARITQFLRHEKFDVLQTYLLYANILGVICGRLAGVPVIGSLRSAGIDRRIYNPLRHRMEGFLLRYGARRTVVNGCSVAEANRSRLGESTMEVIPNAIAVPPAKSQDQRMTTRNRLVGDPNPPLVIAVGRLSPAKGYADLIDAFASIQNRYNNADAQRPNLVIVGDGELRPEIEAQIRALDTAISDHIHLTGARTDIADLLYASDLYVSSSHREGMSVAILEAMAAGLPVIATRAGDAAQVITPDTGILVPPREPQALAAAMQEMLDNPARAKAFGSAAQHHIVQNYDPQKWAGRFLDLYIRVSAAREGGAICASQ